MAPAASPAERVGPHPSYIEIAKPYILQSRMQKCLSEISMTDAKEDVVRLQGVAWIDQVRRALQLPIRTFNTAVIYYHKFRLLHADQEYNWADAAAAALFTACKIEDTLKKSKEILCAHWNLKVGPGESLSSDDPRFENHSKLIIGLERLMLESAGFDFRNRYPQKVMVKLARALKFDANAEAKTTWNLSVDIYRTFAPLKQSTPTMAIACLELAARLHGKDASKFVDAGPVRYSKWATSRAEVMETLLDLLDLYTHHRSATSVGPLYTLEHFINIRIGLNQEASAANISRYAQYASESPSGAESTTNGSKPRNGIDPASPFTPATPGPLSPGTDQAPKSAIGIRGQNGTVRFMLDAARAHDERDKFDKFHKVEEEEYEVEVPNDSTTDDREKERARVGRDTTSTDNSLRDVPVPASIVQKKDTERRGNYWEKFRQRQGGASQSQQYSQSQSQPQAQPQSQLQSQPQTQPQSQTATTSQNLPPVASQSQPAVSPQSQPQSHPQRQPTAAVNDFIHPSRKAANIQSAVDKPREGKHGRGRGRPDRFKRNAVKAGLLSIPGYETRAGKMKRPPVSSQGDAERERIVHHPERTPPRGWDRAIGEPGRGGMREEREDFRRGPSYDRRDLHRPADFSDDRHRRGPPDFTMGGRRQGSPQRDISRSRYESQGKAPQATGYVHQDRMPLVSPAPEPARDSRPQSRTNNERPSAPDGRSVHLIVEKKTVLTAEDGHQWAKSPNDSAGGRGRGRGRGGNQRGRGRGRGAGEADRYVPSPSRPWDASQFDEVYRRR